MYVKSAYKLYFDRILDREEWCVEGDWNKLWSLQIPLKVKHFKWRLGRDCLPNRSKLQNQRVECSLECVVCQILHGVKMASLFSL